jgi:gluconate 2-dehydrogenase gamma chain
MSNHNDNEHAARAGRPAATASEGERSQAPRASRRSFLRDIASVAGAAPLGATALTSAGLVAAADATAAPQPTTAPTSAPSAAAPQQSAAPDSGYQSFSPDEATFVETLVNLMCPADALTPSGVDCGLATYIDRQLAGAFGQGTRRYMQGPWREAKPELGYQLPLTPAQYFKAGLAAAASHCSQRYGKGFDQLESAAATAFLERLAAGDLTDARIALDRWFNELVYPLFVQACFADPIYGGNRNKVFWKMVGYPGLPAVYARDIVDYRGKPHPGARDPKSIADFS